MKKNKITYKYMFLKVNFILLIFRIKEKHFKK